MKIQEDITQHSEKTFYQLWQESQKKNDELHQLIAKLYHQIEKFQQLLFGQKSERRSGKSSKNKLTEIIEDNEKPLLSSGKTETSEISQSVGRNKMFENLAREVIKYEIPEDERQCEHCLNKLHCCGKEISEQLDFIPAKLFVKEHRRYKYRCSRCQHTLTAKMPEQPIDKGLAASGLLTQVLVNKYEYHLPLYRQQRMWLGLGYELSSSTLSDWVQQCGFRLKPIVDAMKEDMLLRAKKIHSDDTTVPVLSKGKTHTGRLWVYVFGHHAAPQGIVYDYSKTRRQEIPANFLKDYQGYLQTDAYAGYNACFKNGKVISVYCWAHVRRKFVDAAKLVKEKVLADEAIDYIGALYQVERQAKSMSDNQRYYYRKHYAKPLLKEWYRWLIAHKALSLPKSPLGQAIAYNLNHWDALTNYLRDGLCEIDNNAAERAIRPVVLGRKNYLFAGSHESAVHAATIYSLIETCKSLEINPSIYLKDVLERLPTTLNKNIQQLIPYYWKPI